MPSTDIRIGDRVRLIKNDWDPLARSPGPPSSPSTLAQHVGKKGTVVECNRCFGTLRNSAGKECTWCNNSINGNFSDGYNFPNYCFVEWDEDKHISGAWLSDLEHLGVLERIAEQVDG